MKKFLFLIFSSLVLFSCDLSNDEESFFPLFFGEQPLSGNFWAQDIAKGSFYRVDAELLASGQYCNVWVEKGSGITTADAQAIANEYDNNIYQEMQDAFGLINFNFLNYNFTDTMQFADLALGDGDGKLCILLLDIKDNYKTGVNDSYVGGYFRGKDLQNVNNSNLRDMIYIDTYPGLSTPKAKETAYKTLAHEMQHLMNFATSFVKRSQSVGDKLYVTLMDEWIDEGLSSAAEWVYDGHSTDRIDWFKNSGNRGLIDKGNNFFVWGNRTTESEYAHLDDYATVYLFFQWLRIQKGGANNGVEIYKNIITSTYSDYRAVTTYAASISANYSAWDTLLKTWLAANYINASSGAYGYMGDSAFTGMKARTAPYGTISLNLYPGEGVYSINVQSSPSGQGTNIRNAYVSIQTLSDSYTQGSTLLTYNANTNTGGQSEIGVTTGVAANQTMRTASTVQSPFSGPFVIDARDLRGRGWQEDTIVEFPFPVNGKNDE